MGLGLGLASGAGLGLVLGLAEPALARQVEARLTHLAIGVRVRWLEEGMGASLRLRQW